MHWDRVTDLRVQIWKHMGCKLLKTVQTITTFRNPLADPVGTRRGPPLVRGPQFENHCNTQTQYIKRQNYTNVLPVFMFYQRHLND